jgi:putative peptidoglycan lipid II flippase
MSVVRVTVSIILATVFSLLLPRVLPISPDWATGGIALASSVAGLVEFFLLRRSLSREIAFDSLPTKYLGSLMLSSLVAGFAGYIVFYFAEPLTLVPVWISGGFAVATFGSVYLGLTLIFKVSESAMFYQKIRRRLPSKKA